MSDVFYNTENLYKNLDVFIEEITEVCYDCSVQHINPKTFIREKIEEDLSLVLDYINSHENIKFVSREQGFTDIVFIKHDYFAWFTMNNKFTSYFIEKYDLQTLG